VAGSPRGREPAALSNSRRPEFLDRLADLVPPPRKHRHRYHGVFALNHKLMLGSVSPHLVRGVTESLAGRVAFVDMQGFSLDDVGPAAERTAWLRGGFPRSFLAADDEASFAWRNDFLRSFIERDFGMLGLGTTPASLGFPMMTVISGRHSRGPNSTF